MKRAIVSIAILAVCVTTAVIWTAGTGDEDIVPEAEVAVHRLGGAVPVIRTPKDKIRKAKRGSVLRMDKAKSHEIFAGYGLEDDGAIDFGDYDKFKGDDNVMARTMDRAFWDDDKETVLATVIEAAGSKNAELREMAIEKAAWFGADGMDALTHYFNDPDEMLAEQARQAWVDGLAEIDDDATRAAMVEPMCREMADSDMVDSMLMSLNSLPNIAQMQVMVSLMDGGSEAAAEAARNHYAFVTGEDFATVETAQKWLDENWEDTDEAYANNESVEDVQNRKFERETYADIDEAAKKLNVTPQQLEKLLGDEADMAEMSGESFVRRVNMAAREAGMTTVDYLVSKMKDAGPAEKAADSQRE